MRFSVLGQLEVIGDDGVEVRVSQQRQRALLAVLLLHANQEVLAGRLAESVWDAGPSSGGAGALRTQVWALRRVLAPARRLHTGQHGGYLLVVGPGELDAARFRELARQGRDALGREDLAGAAGWLSQALALWGEPALADVPATLAMGPVVQRLADERTAVRELLTEVRLRLGQHAGLVPELRESTAADSTNERLWEQLMLALHGAGRIAEALGAYQQARASIQAELGLEPGPGLQQLHRRILAGDPLLPEPGARVRELYQQVLAGSDGQSAAVPSTARGPATTPAVGVTVVPRQLPAAPGNFTARRSELDLLARLAEKLDRAGGAGGTVVISAIDGMAGIGKTALAVHAGHRLAGRFPDGQLFIDLHGYTKGHPPREPGQALEWLLRALGIPAGQVPEDTEARAALYRQRLADTSTLIVLDNAVDEAQVRPLLPGVPGCLVLVTSRRRLKGLDDACTLSLDVLSPADAVALLRGVAGSERVPADGRLAGEVAELCGRLPLALRIVGALLRHRPAWDLEHLAGLLRGRPERVRALFDGERDLGAVFGLSYAGLDEQHRLLFRRLGLVPGPDADAYAAAALLECDPGAATGLLEDLVDHNLLIAHAPGRYRLHDLLRAYAATLAGQDPAECGRAALDRLLHYYAHTSRGASTPIARYPRAPADDPAPAHAPALAGPDAARAWLRAERENLEAACGHARMSALHGHLVALAGGLAEILRSDGALTRALDLHQAATGTAERHGRPAAHANALINLGTARHMTGNLPGAAESFTRALEIYRETGDRSGQAAALAGLGNVRMVTGNLPGATESFTRALEIYRETGDLNGQASMLIDLGIVLRVTGNLPGATESFTRALEIYRETGHRSGEAAALGESGYVRLLTGDLPGAGEAVSQALEVFRETGHRNNEACILNYYAATVAAGGDLPRARALYQQSLAMNRELNKPDDEAIALEGLGQCCLAAGETEPAASHLRQALEIYQRLGMAADARRVQDRLSPPATR